MFIPNLSTLHIGNAAGMVKTPADFAQLGRSAANRRTVGSITTDYRAGNIGETYYFDPLTGASYNSNGLKNPGSIDTLQWLGEANLRCSAVGDELAVSLAAFSPKESAELMGKFRGKAKRLEWNAGCPNAYSASGNQKAIVSLHPDLLHESCYLIGQEIGLGGEASIKLSPIDPLIDPHLLEKIALIIAECGVFDEVIAVNTVPNQRGKRQDGSDALAFRISEDSGETLHTGGLAGTPIKNLGVRMVKALRELLPSSIRIIGCGGISTGEDMLDYLKAGASGIHVGTAFFEQGPRIFTDLLQEALDEMETTGR